MAERNPATDPAIVDALVNGTTPILSARPDRARISARSMSRMHDPYHAMRHRRI
jgi:hypothetical protein